MRISISLKLISVLALFLLSFVAGLPAYSDVVRIGFDHPRPSYIISDATASNSAVARPTGIEIEIVRQAFAQVGMEVLALVAPLKRRIFNLKHGKLDAVATVIEGLKDVFYSDPYVEYQNFAITHVNKSIKLTEIADLANYKLAAWSGASGHLGPIFAAISQKAPLYQELVNQKNQIRMFIKRRVDVAICDGTIFRYFARREGADPRQFNYMPLFGSKTSYQVGFKSEKLRDVFNEGLKKLKTSG